MSKPAVKPRSVTQRIEERIARKKGDVFLRADFRDLGGYRQIGRSLRALIAAGKIVRIGQGIYSRTSTSPFDNSVIPVKSLYRLTEEAFRRLGIETQPSSMLRDYNAGRTTQVPVGRVIGVTRRVRRKIAFGGAAMSFERV